MLYREIIAVCSQIHTKYINTLCGQNVELLNVKTGGTYSDYWALEGPFYTRSQNFEKRLFFVFVYPSVCPNGKAELPLDGFSFSLIFDYFWKICRENSGSIKI